MSEQVTDLVPNYPLLQKLLEAPDSAADAALLDIVRPLCDRSAVDRLAAVYDDGVSAVDIVKHGLHKALDYAAHGALANGFVMQVLDIEWKRLGGKSDDPAPWRDEPPFAQ